jgi:hypothetical protein
MDGVSLLKFARALDLMKRFEADALLGDRPSISLSYAVEEIAKAIGVILEAEFAGDDIELIDDAVAAKRLESGEYTGREREATGNVS